MTKLKYTKNELKTQRDGLVRFERYLPTLQLKKQQLQLEVRHVEARLAEKRQAMRALEDEIAVWVKLFSEPFDFASYLKAKSIEYTVGNIAGVNLPVLQEIVFVKNQPDLLQTPPWIDDGLLVLEQLARLRVEVKILERQILLLSEELRVTSQRVNLFEKVKIPEAKNNIRIIRIFLGDQQTAAVARSKIAKQKMADKAVSL